MALGKGYADVVVRHYRDLLVWQKGLVLARACYEVTKLSPKRNFLDSRVKSAEQPHQLPANIAEGHCRTHTKEFAHYVAIARGSLGEVETHLILCREVGLMEDPELNKLLELCEELSRMLTALRKSLRAPQQLTNRN